MKYRVLFMSAIFMVVLGLVLSSSFAITADEIVTKANIASYYEGNDGRSLIKMEIEARGGRKREKEFVVLRLNVEKGGRQKFYVYYEKPDDIRGTVYMVWKKTDGDDDRWLYLPGLNLVTRVAASDKRSSFAGSDFVYEDISGRNVYADDHELLGEDDSVFRLKSTPKDPGEVEFDHYLTWIRKSDFLPVKIEYYDSKGTIARTVETVESKVINGHPTVTRALSRNRETDSQTVLHFLDVEYDIGLTDDVFTERYLQRPPRRWLK